MEIANNVVSQINKQREIVNANDLTAKLNASSMANTMTNDLFATALNSIPETKKKIKKSKKLNPEQKQELEKLKNELKTLEEQAKKEIAKQEQIEKATNAFFTLEAVFKRRRLQRKYNAKVQQQEVYKSFKTFNAFIKRKEAQRNYINIRHQSFHEKLGMVYKTVGGLLQEIEGEYQKILIGDIPIDIINKRKDLDKRLNEELDFAKDILEILKTKFNEDITAHLYNIDKLKKETVERELGQYGQAKASFLQREEEKMRAELNKQQVEQSLAAQAIRQKTTANLVDNVIKKSLDKIKVKQEKQFTAQVASNLVDNVIKKSLGKIK